MRYSSLIFDLDGTLSDPSEGITDCLRHALRSVGADVPGPLALEQCIGPPLQTVFAELLDDAADVRRAIDAFRDRYSVTGLFQNRLYPGMAEALEALHGMSQSMFVATSKPQAFAVRTIEHFG